MENKYKMVITLDNKLTIATTIIGSGNKLDLSKLNYQKPLILLEDSDGVEIMVNLNHVRSIQYIKETS